MIRNNLKRYIAIILLSSLCVYAQNDINKYFTPANIMKYKSIYGNDSVKRLKIITQTLYGIKNKKLHIKLLTINNIFNRLKYLSDITHWKQDEYWPSPLELIGTGAGDLADISLIKYFALISLGIDKDKLKLVYVKLDHGNTYKNSKYIALAYFHNDKSLPILLDKVNKKIRKIELSNISIADNLNIILKQIKTVNSMQKTEYKLVFFE